MEVPGNFNPPLTLPAVAPGQPLPQPLVEGGGAVGGLPPHQQPAPTVQGGRLYASVCTKIEEHLKAGNDDAAKRLAIRTIPSNGLTVLHIASEDGDLATVEFLLRHGADPTMIGRNGNTALEMLLDSQQPPATKRAILLTLTATSEAYARQVGNEAINSGRYDVLAWLMAEGRVDPSLRRITKYPPGNHDVDKMVQRVVDYLLAEQNAEGGDPSCAARALANFLHESGSHSRNRCAKKVAALLLDERCEPTSKRILRDAIMRYLRDTDMDPPAKVKEYAEKSHWSKEVLAKRAGLVAQGLALNDGQAGEFSVEGKLSIKDHTSLLLDYARQLALTAGGAQQAKAVWTFVAERLSKAEAFPEKVQLGREAIKLGRDIQVSEQKAALIAAGLTPREDNKSYFDIEGDLSLERHAGLLLEYARRYSLKADGVEHAMAIWTFVAQKLTQSDFPGKVQLSQEAARIGREIKKLYDAEERPQ